MIQLLHGDCLELLPTIPDASVDAVITDPPYGTTACKWDSVIPFAPMWAQLKRIIKPRGAIVLFGSQPFTSALVMSNPKWFRYSLVWEKTMALGFLDAKRRPLRAHEDILLFASGLGTYNPQKRSGFKPKRRMQTDQGTKYQGYHAHTRVDWDGTDGTRYPRSVIQFSNHNGALWGNTANATKHPTQKPLPLLEYLVKTYTNEYETVLDFTMGSGTTGHACVNNNRSFIGIERDPTYFSIASERIAAAQQTPQQLLLAS